MTHIYGLSSDEEIIYHLLLCLGKARYKIPKNNRIFLSYFLSLATTVPSLKLSALKELISSRISMTQTYCCNNITPQANVFTQE